MKPIGPREERGDRSRNGGKHDPHDVIIHAPEEPVSTVVRQNKKPEISRVVVELRGKDSNLDYLIQSQASYH